MNVYIWETKLNITLAEQIVNDSFKQKKNENYARVLAAMNPEDIKSFSIYTDEDAIKAYGTRGTGGVVVIKSNLSKRKLKKRVKEYNKKRKVKS